jgi:succinyl-CoA synthetase alpha subunit
MIGEIGGSDEQLAAEYIKEHVAKPVFAYIAGHSAPPGVQLGHAGAILGSKDESADAKTKALAEAGAKTVNSIAELKRGVS